MLLAARRCGAALPLPLPSSSPVYHSLLPLTSIPPNSCPIFNKIDVPITSSPNAELASANRCSTFDPFDDDLHASRSAIYYQHECIYDTHMIKCPEEISAMACRFVIVASNVLEVSASLLCCSISSEEGIATHTHGPELQQSVSSHAYGSPPIPFRLFFYSRRIRILCVGGVCSAAWMRPPLLLFARYIECI